MMVEPESLCWLTGRRVKARDGATWAEEFARFPALQAVVLDDGSGLGKGVKLERTRRRAAGQPDLDDSLDVFHTLREGGRALRKTWGAASRALERADRAQKDIDRRGRQGQSCRGHGAPRNRHWRQAERLWDQAVAAEAAWASRPGGRLSSSARTVVSTIVQKRPQSWPRSSRTSVARLGPRPGACCCAVRALRSSTRCKIGWLDWDWTPTFCRRCWTWKVCTVSRGDDPPRHAVGP